VCLLGGVASAADDATSTGDQTKPDQSQYDLFHPTPRAFLREMNTDRPDKTESPYTIDAGHFQIEADILNYTLDRHNPDRTDTSVETVGIAPMNLKAGVCHNVDVQLILQTYNSVRTHDFSAGTVEKQRGFGDVIGRVKWNWWGNDGGPTAMGVIPYLKLPTHQDHLGNNSVEGGVIFPLAVDLPGGWSMGAMTQFDIIRDNAGNDYHPEFVNSVTFSHAIIGRLEGYVEFFSAVSAESGSDWIGTMDTGLTFKLTADVQLDMGVNLGVTRAADDINPFIGISWRF
jgi:hypothetical protein